MKTKQIILFITIISLFTVCKSSNQKEIGIPESKNVSVKTNQIKALNDTCLEVKMIRKTIVDFIENRNEEIYKDDFVTSISKINKIHGKCFFPNNSDDIKLYFILGDSVLLNKVEHDMRAMKLLIELYLVNRNNAELSEYYGFRILPKAATKNIKAFVQVISKFPEKDANKCIGKLKYIKEEEKINKIKSDINKITEQDYNPIINKIKEKLPK